MGFWSFSWLLGAPAPSASAGAPVLASPHSGDNLAATIVGDIIGMLPTEGITRDTAPRVPELKRALKAHQALVAPLAFEKFEDDKLSEVQPFWVASCAYPGMSRYIAYKKLVEELFWEGTGVLACRLATDGTVYDWVTIPRHLWTLDSTTGKVTLHDSIPDEYRMRVVLVPLGANGVLVDGIDSIRQSRKLEKARQNRLDAPPAATELHITDPNFDSITKQEKEALAAQFVETRQKHSVSVTPSYIEVKERGTGGTLDLFEDAKASLSRELAMHAGVPASFVESASQGGGGQMSYSNQQDRQSELWTYGSAEYAYAITAALSGDDVVGPNAEVRADLSHFSVPAPTSIDPEAGDTETTPEEN